LNLFHCPDAKSEAILDSTVFQTPLGQVRLEAAISGIEITDKPPTETYRLSADGWVASWHQDDFDLELLVCRLILPIPIEPPLTDCWAGLWRLRAKAAVGPCVFTAQWEAGYTWQESSPSSGERLYAKNWNDTLTEVSIGTEDEEGLEGRAHHAHGLPPEWEPYFRFNLDGLKWDWQAIPFWQHDIHQELGDRGLALPLPSLKMSQQCQVHFVVAWSNYQKNAVTTWLAVDQRAGDILANAGCS
jgi:hypothetical protein